MDIEQREPSTQIAIAQNPQQYPSQQSSPLQNSTLINPQSIKKQHHTTKVLLQSLNQQQSMSETNQEKFEGADGTLNKLKHILDKNYQFRSGSQNIFITEFIKQNLKLSKFSENVSLEFVKNIMKTASIEIIRPGVHYYRKKDRIQEFGVILSGKVAVMAEVDNYDTVQQTDENAIFQKMITISQTYVKMLKKKHLHLSNNLQHQKKQNNSTYISSSQNNLEIINYLNVNDTIGLQDRCIGEEYQFNYVIDTEQPLVLLNFNEKPFMLALQYANKQKIKQLSQKIKEIPCFNIFQQEKIKKIISNLQLKKKHKFESIFQQGQPITNFYFLRCGQVKMNKQTCILQQNPNSLYYDRQKLIEESLSKQFRHPDKSQRMIMNKKIKKSILPFADFSKMYNFIPNKKNIEIGLIHPFCLFGEEEYLTTGIRDVTAICDSIDVEYYEIEISVVENIIGGKLLNIFKNQLKNNIMRKILYRQSQYANNISLQNKNGLDYFYYRDDKEKQSPRKFRITKLNSLIDDHRGKSREYNTTPTPTACYTSQNFNKMMKEEPSSVKSKIQTSQSQNLEEQTKSKNTDQLNIMNITHTWKLMEQKVHQEIRTSRKISPIKPTINLKKPLIEAEYFLHVEKQKKRIERDYKKRLLSLGKINKNSKQKIKSIHRRHGSLLKQQ